MWSRIALLSAFAWLTLQPQFGAAQDSFGRPADTPTLLAKTSWARFDVIGGRIAVLGNRCGQCRSNESDATIPRESLAVQLRGVMLLLQYEYEADSCRREISIDDIGTLRIHSIQTGMDPHELTLLQPLEGKLSLTVTGPGAHQVSAPSLWHLLIDHPELCQTHLLPVLDTLRPDWRLAEQADEIRTALLDTAGIDVLAERAEWKRWVADLRSDDFQKRQAADRALRSIGQPITAWLSRLDRETLDSEQRQRIDRICLELADPHTDTAQRVVNWMIDDKAVWLSLIARGDLEERIAAAEHLSKLCRRSIPFDPHADEPARRLQVNALMARYGQ